MKSILITLTIVLIGFVCVYMGVQSRGRHTGAIIVPPWANFFSGPQYALFLSKVENYFAQKHIKISINDGEVRAENNPNVMGLQNLGQMCRQSPEADWGRFIAEHFDRILGTEQSEQELKKNIGNLAAVQNWLAVRIWPPAYVKALGEAAFISRVDLPGTISVLVWDLPTHQRNVKPEEIKAWGKSPEELFAIGLGNLKNDKQIKILEQDFKDGVKIKFLVGDSFLVASCALVLDQQPGFVGKFGSIVAIPHRHMLMSFPIENLSIIQAINKLIPLVQKLEKEGPGSISSKLYWYHDHKFTDLPYAITGQKIDFKPPDEFVGLLNGLQPPPAQSQ